MYRRKFLKLLSLLSMAGLVKLPVLSKVVLKATPRQCGQFTVCLTADTTALEAAYWNQYNAMIAQNIARDTRGLRHPPC
jgi:hypothetical protein